jgi:hypothetical protein
LLAFFILKGKDREKLLLVFSCGLSVVGVTTRVGLFALAFFRQTMAQKELRQCANPSRNTYKHSDFEVKRGHSPDGNG